MGRIAMTFAKASHPLSVVFYGGGRLINIPPGPTFARTVNGPKIIDLSKGDPSPPCSVLVGRVGGALRNVPSGPTLTRTVNGPNSLDLSNG